MAVIVDDDEQTTKGSDGKPVRVEKPRDPGSLKKIQGLVAAAVGLDETRGDLLTVEAIPFDEPAPVEEEPAPVWKSDRGAEAAGGRPHRHGARAGPPGLLHGGPAGHAPHAGADPESAAVMPRALPKTVDQLQGELEAQLHEDPGQSAGSKRAQALTKRVAMLSEKEPENVARLLRTWLSEGER